MRQFGKNQDIDLVAAVEGGVPVHAAISGRSVARIKAQASQCDASQGGGAPRVVMSFAARPVGGSEHFSRAVPAHSPAHVERDLFQGVAER